MSLPAPLSVSFTLGNRQQVANALPVARELGVLGIPCRLLSLDAFYGQQVDELLNRQPLPAGVHLQSLDLPRLDPPFSQRSLPGKWRIVQRHARPLRRILENPGALVLGVDGAVERLLLSRHRNRTGGLFSAILWDGMAARRPHAPSPTNPADFRWMLRTWIRFHLRRATLATARRLRLDPFVPGLAPHSPVDRIFVMGRFVADALANQGVPSPVEVTGLPRFCELLEAPHLEPVGEKRVLYLTSAFLWHDDEWLHRCQQADLEALATHLPAHGWTLHVRPHPREPPEQYDHLHGRSGVEVSRGTSLRQDARRAAVVVTAVSTAAAETLAMGRSAVVYLDAFPSALQTSTLGTHPSIPLAQNPAELLQQVESLAHKPPPPSLVDDFFAPTTPDSARLIAAHVADHLAQP